MAKIVSVVLSAPDPKPPNGLSSSATAPARGACELHARRVDSPA